LLTKGIERNKESLRNRPRSMQ